MAGERTGDDGDTTHWERLAREKKNREKRMNIVVS